MSFVSFSGRHSLDSHLLKIQVRDIGASDWRFSCYKEGDGGSLTRNDFRLADLDRGHFWKLPHKQPSADRARGF